jgi:hypothetical protein
VVELVHGDDGDEHEMMMIKLYTKKRRMRKKQKGPV